MAVQPAAPAAPAGELRLDPSNACLWRGKERLALTPKAFAVLRHLVENPERLVTKSELLETLWADTYVGDAALKVTILEIRKALGDSHREPRFIATVHRHGYRFLGGIALVPPPPRSPRPASPQRDAVAAPALPALASPATPEEPVGRHDVRERLDAMLAAARAGERRIVFLTGEAGSGKSAVLDAFLASLGGEDAALVARAQCRETYGRPEPHMPLLEALGALCRAPAGARVVELLHRQAPAWLAQMPWLVEREERCALQRETAGAGAGRMLREVVTALESLATAGALVLALEDLQWSDAATLDVLAALASARGPARLLVLATYRPCDVAPGEGSVRRLSRELALCRLCEELALRALSEDEVAQLVARRLAPATPPAGLAALVHRRSAGNPSFAIELVEHLLQEGMLARDGECVVLHADDGALSRVVPEPLRATIEKRCERLPAEDGRLLEAASVAGDEFAASELALALGGDAAALEERCARLARHQRMLEAAGVAKSSGGVAARWRFRHALVRDVLRERATPLRRAEIELALAAARQRQAAVAPEVRVQRARCTGRLHVLSSAGSTAAPRRLAAWSGKRAAR